MFRIFFTLKIKLTENCDIEIFSTMWFQNRIKNFLKAVCHTQGHYCGMTFQFIYVNAIQLKALPQTALDGLSLSVINTKS